MSDPRPVLFAVPIGAPAADGIAELAAQLRSRALRAARHTLYSLAGAAALLVATAALTHAAPAARADVDDLLEEVADATREAQPIAFIASAAAPNAARGELRVAQSHPPHSAKR